MLGTESGRRSLAWAWGIAIAAALGQRLWNALAGPLLLGYDSWGHVAYVLFLDLYHALPYGDQGWSFFHPPLYYALGFAMAQLGDADLLARGLGLLGSLASLSVAAAAALLVRRALPEPAWLAWLAFVALAFLPVHIYVGPMVGNEMLAAALSAAALAHFLLAEVSGEASTSRSAKLGRRDLVTGVLAAAALLSKYNALTPVAAILATPLLLAWGRRRTEGELGRAVVRVAVLLLPIALLAGPIYMRNAFEFGTPFSTSHGHPKVKAIESAQAPGERSWVDFVAPPSPALLSNSSADGPALVHSVWGTAYLSGWFDLFRASQFPRFLPFPLRDYPIHNATLTMGALGLVPTALALLGLAAMFRNALRLLRGRSAVEGHAVSIVDLTLSLVALGTLGLFVAFAIKVPTFAAVKASYLLNLSLPLAWGLARAVRLLWERSGRRNAVLGAALAAQSVAALGSLLVLTSGLVYPERPDSTDMYALRAHFGETERARAWVRLPVFAESRNAVELAAAIELGEGDYVAARDHLLKVAKGPLPPEFVNALVAATALSGDPREALRLSQRLQSSGGESGFAEAQLNRGSLLALRGDLEAGRLEVEAALRRSEEMVPGWSNLAEILDAQGQTADAKAARDRALHFAARAPRAFPYGVGDGDLDYAGRGQRWMLRLQLGRRGASSLELYRPLGARWGPPREGAAAL